MYAVRETESFGKLLIFRLLENLETQRIMHRILSAVRVKSMEANENKLRALRIKLIELNMAFIEV